MVVIRTIHSLLSHVQLIIFNSDIPPYHDAKLFNIPLPLFPTFFPFLWHIFSFYLVLKCPKNVDCHFLLLVISYLCELMWAVYKIIKLMFRLTDRVMIHWLLSHRSHKTRLGFPLTKTWRHISIAQSLLSVWLRMALTLSRCQVQVPVFHNCRILHLERGRRQHGGLAPGQERSSNTSIDPIDANPHVLHLMGCCLCSPYVSNTADDMSEHSFVVKVL